MANFLALNAPLDDAYVQADSNNWWNLTNEVRCGRLDTAPGAHLTPDVPGGKAMGLRFLR